VVGKPSNQGANLWNKAKSKTADIAPLFEQIRSSTSEFLSEFLAWASTRKEFLGVFSLPAGCQAEFANHRIHCENDSDNYSLHSRKSAGGIRRGLQPHGRPGARSGVQS
jgi:hypothetical protein